MGELPRLHRSSGLRLLLHLAALVAALCVLCVVKPAHAATSLAVPMCGDHAESIVAPPIFRAKDAGSIAPLPCQSEELAAGRSAPPAPQRLVIQDSPERALAFAVLGVTQSESSRLPVAARALELTRPGFARLLFRPPRA